MRKKCKKHLKNDEKMNFNQKMACFLLKIYFNLVKYKYNICTILEE